MRARPLAGVLLVFCLGCGPGGPFKYVAVQGVLSYEDGVPVPVGGIQLKFIAQDAPLVEGASPRPAIAHLNAQGQFDCATSYKYGDGLVPGKHALGGDSAKEFARGVVTLLQDPDLRRSLSREGRALAATLPTWQDSTERVASAIKRVCRV